MCQREIGFERGLVAGPASPARRAELVALSERQDVASARALLGGGFDGRDGARELRESALPGAVADASYATADAWELIDVDGSWEEILTYEDRWDGFTEVHEVEWELVTVVELWDGGEVLGYLAHDEATVSYWHPSDPDDPIQATFEAFVIIDAAGVVVRTMYAGP